MVHIEFDSKLQVLNCIMTDTIGVDEIVDFIETISCVDYLPPNLKMLVNMLNAEVSFDVKDLQQIIDAHNMLFKKHKTIKYAIVMNSPKTAALAIYYKKLNANSNYFFEVFSTLKAAQWWIQDN